MSTGWLVYVLAVGTLLAFGATALASALRAMGRSTRGVYALAIAGMIVLAVIAPRQPQLPMSMVASAVVESAPSVATPRAITLADRARLVRARVDGAAAGLTASLDRIVSPATRRVTLAAWATMSALLLTLFALVNGRLTAARQRWPARSLHGATVRVSPAFGPAVLGLLRAEIVVPRSLLERTDEEQRLILAHEREHLRARDHLLLSAAWLGVISLPWHPAVWYLANRIRLAIELDCDARVLRGGASQHAYGALLIDMAAHTRGLHVGALALADEASHLERRILAMKWTEGRHAAARGLLLGGLGGLLVLAACEAKVPTAAQVASMDVNALEKTAAQLDAVDAKIANADYFVNGAPVSADSARAIAAAKIGSVEVVKGKAAGGRDTIFVTTADRMMRVRSDDEDLVPFPEMANGLGSNAVLMIDNVVQTPGMKVHLAPQEVASISVMKPGKDPMYPNGVISVTTKKSDRSASAEQRSNAPVPFRARERRRTVTRTDSVIVRSAAGLSSATRLLTDSAKGPDRVVFMSSGDSARRFGFSVGDLERASAANAAPTSSRAVPRATFDSTKPYAIEIDGRRATIAELKALKGMSYIAHSMYLHDMSAESSDPAARNGLLRVTTKKPAKQ